MKRGAHHAMHFRPGYGFGRLQTHVHDVGGEFFVAFDWNREIAVAAAGFNVKTHDFVGHERLLFGLRNDVLVSNAVFVSTRGLLLCFNGFALDLDPAGWTDVFDVEVAQQGRDVGLIYVGVLVAARVQAQVGPFALIPQVLDAVHGRHVFEFEKEEFVVFSAVKPVERLAAQELAFVDQNGILAEFSDVFFQVGNEARLGFKPPRLRDLDVEEGFIIAHNDAAGFAPFIDAEHLNYEVFFVLGLFLITAAAAIAACTSAAGAGARHFITHLKIK